MQPIRWGMIGTGRMAASMATEFAQFEPTEALLCAVASRARHKAQEFADRHRIARSHACTADLLADPGIDAVYIASPHPQHAADMLAAIAAGKAVLCEKPFTINAVQAQAVIDAARRRGVLVMEALWSRFLPAIQAVRDCVAAGRIGRIRLIIAGGAFVPDWNSDHYLLDRERGGGVLLDAGVYLVSLSSMLLGAPSRVQASGSLGGGGIDEQETVLLDHAGGAQACLYVSLHARRSPDMEILGDAGRLRIAAPLFRPTQVTHYTADGVESVQQYPIEGSGYGAQVLALQQALRAGLAECPGMPLAETLSVMRTLDEVRRQIGLHYPGERP